MIICLGIQEVDSGAWNVWEVRRWRRIQTETVWVNELWSLELWCKTNVQHMSVFGYRSESRWCTTDLIYKASQNAWFISTTIVGSYLCGNIWSLLSVCVVRAYSTIFCQSMSASWILLHCLQNLLVHMKVDMYTVSSIKTSGCVFGLMWQTMSEVCYSWLHRHLKHLAMSPTERKPLTHTFIEIN